MFFFFTMEKKTYYKLLSFCILLKLNRKNSMIYNEESIVQLSSDLKINFRTFKKYLDASIKHGLIKKQGNHLYAIKYRYLISEWSNLNGQDKNLQKFFTHLYAFKKTKYNKVPSFKDIYNQVVESIIFKNFKQQEYKILKEQEKIEIYRNSLKSGCNPVDRRSSKILKSLTKEASQRRKSTDAYVKCMEMKKDKYIKTGKNHIAKLLGMSSATGQRRLKKLETSEKVQREVIRVNTGLPAINECFDVLKEEKKLISSTATIVPMNKTLWLCKGSKITLNPIYMDDFYSVGKINKLSTKKVS